MKNLVVFSITVFGLLLMDSCKKDDPLANVEGQLYEVTFTGKWSSSTHPADYPAGAHFSAPIGMSHAVGESFFTIGKPAGPGMKEMAERGATSPLDSEINNLISMQKGLALYMGDGLPDGTSSVVFEIKVSEKFPLVTLVSMLAPSPDWFVAVKDLALYQQGGFVSEITVDALVLDAGTDSGLTFTSPNTPTIPADSIKLIHNPPLGNGLTVTPTVATFRFVKK